MNRTYTPQEQMEADLKACRSTLDEVQRASAAEHYLVTQLRDGIARMEHMAQTGQAFGEDRGPNSALRQIIDEARRLLLLTPERL